MRCANSGSHSLNERTGSETNRLFELCSVWTCRVCRNSFLRRRVVDCSSNFRSVDSLFQAQEAATGKKFSPSTFDYGFVKVATCCQAGGVSYRVLYSAIALRDVNKKLQRAKRFSSSVDEIF